MSRVGRAFTIRLIEFKWSKCVATVLKTENKYNNINTANGLGLSKTMIYNDATVKKNIISQ